MYIRAGESSAQRLLLYTLGDDAASSREANRRFKRVAALVTEGLKTAKDAIPQLSSNGQQELLRFMTSLLETYFFPRGHGLIDAQGKVLRQSQKATVEIPVEAKDGSRWRFSIASGSLSVNRSGLARGAITMVGISAAFVFLRASCIKRLHVVPSAPPCMR